MSSKMIGFLAVLIAVMSYGMYGVYARIIGLQFGPFSQNYIRNILVMILVISISIAFKKKWKKIRKEDWPWMLFWTLGGSISMVGFFIAANHIPIATVYLLLFIGMLTSGYFGGYLLYKEKLTKIKIISLVLIFIGLSLIYSIKLTGDVALYGALSLIIGVASGTWLVVSKKFSHKYPNIQLLAFDAFFTILVSVMGAILVREQFPAVNIPLPWFGIIMYAVTSVAASGLVIFGYKHLEAQIGSILLPLEIVFGAIFALIFYKEIPGVMTIIGGTFIIIAAILPPLSDLRKHQKNLFKT